EAKETLAVREICAWTRVLHDCGLPTRQVAYRPVADPGVLKSDEEGLGTAPFSPRALDVGLIPLGGARDFAGVSHPPAVALEKPPILHVAFREQQRQLERLTRQP